jgi:hypothetical protein
VENMLYQATDAPKGDAGCAKPRVHQPLEHPRLSLLETLPIIQPSSGRFGKPLKLAAPQCVASLGVRFDLHLIAACLGTFFRLGQPIGVLFWMVREIPQISYPTMRCQPWCSS